LEGTLESCHLEALIDGSVSPEPPRAGGPRAISMERLLRGAEAVAYWLVIAPLAARLPASLAYRIACWRGDWCLRYRAAKRAEILRNARRVLGDELGPEQAENLAREFFRMTSCEAIDVMRLRGQARSLAQLVEIRGGEHLDAALAAGKGAILCTAHFGSCSSAFSLLHAAGYPLTVIGRTFGKHETDMSSSTERRLWDFVMTRRLRRHRQRPNIEPLPGRLQVVVQAAVALRGNEVVTISSDAAPLGADQARTVEMPFLGRQARLLPGVVGLARLTAAPVLMMFVYRCADYRHQVLEISPAVSMEGETTVAFARCVAAIEAAVRKSPASWVYWANTEDLADLGLLTAADSPDDAGALDSSSSSTAV
jgi:lauroyl/myristoyl acyltransferase